MEFVTTTEAGRMLGVGPDTNWCQGVGVYREILPR